MTQATLMTASGAVVLPSEAWREAEAAHEARVDGLLREHLRRAARGERHPVEDFLFTYYSHRPAQLHRWHPGAGVVLAGAGTRGGDYRDTDAGAVLDVDALLARRGESVGWIRALLAATAGRPPHLGCFGIHEWAMVYRQSQEQVRHDRWPLRLTADETAAVVHEREVRCSHFDAYRFFSDAARPLNLLSPTRAAQHQFEQPGCLHANMDLYKWAYKLSPLIPSELVADCFVLARDIRTVDMRASPYDLTGLGYSPIRIETAPGRAEYAAAQRGFAERAAPLRQALIAAVDAVDAAGTGRSPR